MRIVDMSSEWMVRKALLDCDPLLLVYHCDDGYVAVRRLSTGFQPTPWECPLCGKQCQADDLNYDLAVSGKAL